MYCLSKYLQKCRHNHVVRNKDHCSNTRSISDWLERGAPNLIGSVFDPQQQSQTTLRYVVTLVVRSRATHLQNKRRAIKSLRSAGISLLLTPAPLKSHTNINCIQYRTDKLSHPASLEKSIWRNHKAYLIIIPDIFAPDPPATSHSLPLVQNYRLFSLELNKWLTRHTGVSLVIYKCLGPVKGCHGNKIQ